METLVYGVPIVVLTPGLVEVLKRCGLAPRYAGAAAIACAALLAALADVAGMGGPPAGLPLAARAAAWLLAGIVYGLAAAGLYTQGRALASLPRARPEA